MLLQARYLGCDPAQRKRLDLSLFTSTFGDSILHEYRLDERKLNENEICKQQHDTQRSDHNPENTVISYCGPISPKSPIPLHTLADAKMHVEYLLHSRIKPRLEKVHLCALRISADNVLPVWCLVDTAKLGWRDFRWVHPLDSLSVVRDEHDQTPDDGVAARDCEQGDDMLIYELPQLACRSFSFLLISLSSPRPHHQVNRHRTAPHTSYR